MKRIVCPESCFIAAWFFICLLVLWNLCPLATQVGVFKFFGCQTTGTRRRNLEQLNSPHWSSRTIGKHLVHTNGHRLSKKYPPYISSRAHTHTDTDTHLNTRLFCFCPNSGEIPTRGERGRRGTKEKHVGIFFPSQIFRVSEQQLHGSVTRCFPTLSDQKNHVSAQSQSVLRGWERLLFLLSLSLFSFHDVLSVQFEISRQYFQLIFQGRWGSTGPRTNAKVQSAGEKTTEITATTAALGFCVLVSSLSLDCSLSCQTQTYTDTRAVYTILNLQGH